MNGTFLCNYMSRGKPKVQFFHDFASLLWDMRYEVKREIECYLHNRAKYLFAVSISSAQGIQGYIVF